MKLIDIVLIAFLIFIISVGMLVSKEARAVGDYVASYSRAVDGDTVELAIMIWPKMFNIQHVRVAGIDAPEMHGKCGIEKVLAKDAKEFVHEVLSTADVIVVDVLDIGKFGRPIANITYDDKDLAQELLDAGLARLYDGKARLSWCNEQEV